MFEIASSLVLNIAGLLLLAGPFLVAAYVMFRSSRRVMAHMDRVEMELVTLNRQISELTEKTAGQIRPGR